jgi:glyoxylase-like metal-dependent hydrolase (beta-lactamase superfamily II)
MSADPQAPLAEEIAPGILRVDSWLPFKGLKQINLWFLEDGDGWTMIDCGFAADRVREQLEVVWATCLNGKPVTRLIVTHFHPDHMSNCRWICDRWKIEPWMTTPEWFAAQLAIIDKHTDDVPNSATFYRRHDLAERFIETYNEGFILYSGCVELSDTYRSIADNEVIAIGGRKWRVVQGAGHSPAMASLYCEELGIFIAGDQVLPKISPNISIVHWDPHGDPLQAYFTSLDRMQREIADDVLVLPSHRLPFRGLHTRLNELRAHHHSRLDKIRDMVPVGGILSGADCMAGLFGHDLDGQQVYFAMGEALAHINYLCSIGDFAFVETAESYRYKRVR